MVMRKLFSIQMKILTLHAPWIELKLLNSIQNYNSFKFHWIQLKINVIQFYVQGIEFFFMTMMWKGKFYKDTLNMFQNVSTYFTNVFHFENLLISHISNNFNFFEMFEKQVSNLTTFKRLQNF
jgi:hypothetical protein